MALAALYLVGTPIGNLEDITLRALRVLASVDALACEDTRRTRALLTHHGIRTPSTLFSLHEHNEDRALGRVLSLLERGLDVALCSDAGTPLISDPGFPTVREAVARGHAVEVVPGPSAVTAALAVSGLPAASFTFKGFAPRKPGPRRRYLETELPSPHTLVLFESPHRLAGLLKDALQVFGERPACVCVELTKKFEEVRRGTLPELVEQLAERPVRGEVTVVIAPPTRAERRAFGPQPTSARGRREDDS
jgi:16S rRNA (cytidine1402-2'-O)-methyltransferase